MAQNPYDNLKLHCSSTARPDLPATEKLLDQLRDAIRLKHDHYRTEQNYPRSIPRCGMVMPGFQGRSPLER